MRNEAETKEILMVKNTLWDGLRKGAENATQGTLLTLAEELK